MTRSDFLARKPDSLSFQDAACLGTPGIPAWSVLLGKTTCRPGAHLFVTGCGGAIGDATLQDMGADITGEPGIGYVMKPGFLLPPLSFTDEEIQALVIGGQWVSRQSDDALTAAMRNALAKITAVLSAQARPRVDDDAFYVGVREKPTAAIELGALRRALRDQCKLRIVLSVDNAPKTPQVVWPIMLAFIDGKRYIAAWCEFDSVYRVISLHDVAEASVLTERYPRNRRQLVREWRSLRLLPCNANGEAC